MSSQAFVRGVILGAFAATVVAAIPPLLIDPSGYLRTVWMTKPQVCTPGISADVRIGKSLMASDLTAREILFGNSHVDRGFSFEDAAALLKNPVVNLALDGASPAEVESLFTQAITTKGLERAWLAVEFTDLYPMPGVSRSLRRYDNKAARVGAALWGGDNLSAAMAVLLNPGRCASPEYDLNGFRRGEDLVERIADLGWSALVERSRRNMRNNLSERVAAPASARTGRVAEQWRRLHRMVRMAREANVALVIFICPTHRYYREAVEAAGLETAFKQWRHDMEKLSRESGVEFFDWSDYEPTLAMDLEHCDPTADSKCPMYDVHHFRPPVGRMMLEQMLLAMNRGSALAGK